MHTHTPRSGLLETLMTLIGIVGYMCLYVYALCTLVTLNYGSLPLCARARVYLGTGLAIQWARDQNTLSPFTSHPGTGEPILMNAAAFFAWTTHLFTPTHALHLPHVCYLPQSFPCARAESLVPCHHEHSPSHAFFLRQTFPLLVSIRRMYAFSLSYAPAHVFLPSDFHPLPCTLSWCMLHSMGCCHPLHFHHPPLIPSMVREGVAYGKGET